MVLMSISGEERYVYRIDVPGWIAAGATVVLDNTPLPIVPECLWAWNDGLGELEGGEAPEQPVAPTTGAINTLSNGSLVGGSGYTDGVYTGVALTGGTGSGATADINVSGGAVTVVSLQSGGADYTAGDVLSAVLVYIGTTFLSLSTSQFALVNLLLVGVWIYLALRIGREYRKLTAEENQVAE